MTKTTITRRRMLGLGTASIAALGLAGCLGDGQLGGSRPDDGNGDDPGDGNESDPDSDSGTGGDGGNEDGGNGNGENGDDDDGEVGDGDDTESDRADPPAAVQPREDEPPYEITVPDCGGENDDRDDRYLCANMPAEPSLEFEQTAASGSIFADEGLESHQGDGEAIAHEFYVALLTEESDRERVRDEDQGPAAMVADTDFEGQAVLVVETGWGSGAVLPHIKRLEETEDGVHAHGCYERPCLGTTDVTVRTAAVRFDRPDALEEAIVSLTVDEETRYHVAATEDVVSIRADGDDSDG